MHDNRRTRLVLGVLLIIAITLITLDFRDGGASPARGLGADIFGPIERVTHDVTDPVASVFDSITGGPSAQGTITTLQRQNAELRAELSAAQLNKSARKQLAQLLQLDAGGYQIVTANVIAAGGGFSDTVTLDVGSDDGIKADETVLNGSGFVGLVTQVSANTSTVLLASDASSVVGVQLAGSGEIGAVTGTGKSLSGSAMLRLSLFDANAVLHARPAGRHLRLDRRQTPGARRARRHDRVGERQRGRAHPDRVGAARGQLHRPRRGRRGSAGAAARREDLDPATAGAHGHRHRDAQPAGHRVPVRLSHRPRLTARLLVCPRRWSLRCARSSPSSWSRSRWSSS